MAMDGEASEEEAMTSDEEAGLSSFPMSTLERLRSGGAVRVAQVEPKAKPQVVGWQLMRLFQ